MKKIAVISLLVLGFSPWCSYSYSLDQVLIQMENKERSMERIQFKFKQDIQFKEAGLTEKIEGQATFQKPNKMKISKQSPQNQVTISNGISLWVYTPSYKQVWVGKWKDWLHNGSMPQGIIPVENYVEDLKKNFNLSFTEDDDNDNQVHLAASPKEKDKGYELELVISTDSWLPIQTIYRSDSAIVTTSLFSMEQGPRLADDMFTFIPPKGTDIIHLDQ